MNKPRIAIVGASELGRQLDHHFKCTGTGEVIGFFDDFATVGEKILGSTASIIQCYLNHEYDLLCIGVGYKAMRFRHQIFMDNCGLIPFANVVYPSAYVDSSAIVGEGCVILPQSVLDQNVVVDGNSFISLAVTISHDSKIGMSSYLSPRVTICGNCNVGERVFLGAGCVIRDGISICSDVVVGAGAVVVKDIVVPGIYFGNPARKQG